MQPELQVAAFDLCGSRHVAEQLEGAAVPKHDTTATVLALRNVALETSVVDWMVFHMNGEGLRQWFQARAFGNSPGFESAVHLQPEVIMQPRGVVSLDAEVVGGRRSRGCGPGLWCLVERPFALVFLQRHYGLALSWHNSRPSLTLGPWTCVRNPTRHTSAKCLVLVTKGRSQSRLLIR